MKTSHTTKTPEKASDDRDMARHLSDAEARLGHLLGITTALADVMAANCDGAVAGYRLVRGAMALSSAIEDAAESALEHIEAARLSGRAKPVDQDEAPADRASRLAFELADTMNAYADGRMEARVYPSVLHPDWPVAFRPMKPSAATGGDNYAALVTLLDERRERVEAHHAAIDAFTPLERGPRDADYEAAEARVRAALEAAYEVETRIIELPARSLRDLRVKLDLVENQGPKKGAWYFDGDQLQALLLSLRGVFGGGHGAQG